MDGKDSQQGGPDTGAARHTEVCAQTCTKGGDVLVDAQLLGQLVDRDRDGANTALRSEGDSAGGPDALEELDRIQLADDLDERALDHEGLNRAEDISQHQNAQQGDEVGRRRAADGTGNEGQDGIRSEGDDIADHAAHHNVTGVDKLLEGGDLLGLLGGDLVVADGGQNAEDHDGHHLAVCPVGSEVLGEEADNRVHKGGDFLGGVIGGQLILHTVADIGHDTSDQGDEAGEEGVQDEEENSLEADVLQADGIAQIGDAGNDAEDQQRDDHSRNDVGVDGTHSGDIGVVALEHEAHDEAEAHSQNGAHAEVNLLFPVQVVQQGKKYGSQGQCGQIQNFYRHKTDPPLFLSVMSFLSVNTFALS